MLLGTIDFKLLNITIAKLLNQIIITGIQSVNKTFQNIFKSNCF